MLGLIHVLVVDDEPIARQTVRAQLNRPGFTLTEANSGEQALKMLPSTKPDVILLDVMMPGLDGYETCKRIKSDPQWETTPVVLCTALETQEERNEGLRAGADEFLTKPVNSTELRLRLRNLAQVKAYHDLLAYFLLPSIAKRLRDEPGFTADQVESATVLFTDLKGFVTFANNRSANEVVMVLNELFTGFDEVGQVLGLEKIKTIGDAYMLAGCLSNDQDSAAMAQKVIWAGVQFFEVLAEVNRRHGLDLALRVGAHTGPVIAGVIGQSRLAYDLWGDTVNLASRLESHGVPGQIQISAQTHALLDGRFESVPRGEIEIKGRGPLETWLIPVA